jgi:hypothetical protein
LAESGVSGTNRATRYPLSRTTNLAAGAPARPTLFPSYQRTEWSLPARQHRVKRNYRLPIARPRPAIYKTTKQLSCADALAAALARLRNAEPGTGDPEFKEVESEIKIGWLQQ